MILLKKLNFFFCIDDKRVQLRAKILLYTFIYFFNVSDNLCQYVFGFIWFVNFKLAKGLVIPNILAYFPTVNTFPKAIKSEKNLFQLLI